jgi:hypothetical protein
MSSGGISQLVAIGAQDAFLVGTPQVSFFQSAYKQHTNFSTVVDRQLIQGTPTAGGMSSVRFERSGDMLGYVFMAPIIAGPTAYATQNWSNLINYVEFYIGGQLIDRQDSTFTEYLAPDLFAQNLSKSSLGSTHGGANSLSYFYPLRFWFCENWQSALPLVALQYHDVEIRIYWGPNANSDVGNAIINWEVYTQYIYLDTMERKLMTDKTHTLLINQVQYMNPTNSKMMPVVFNHPMKYLCATPGTAATSNLTSNTNMLIVQINGTDIADFKFACPHFTAVPSFYTAPFSTGNDNAFFYFPFCLDSSRFQPTGSLNFSRLDSVRIVSQTGIITNTVYGVNYNILKIQNGMGGLMYSN